MKTLRTYKQFLNEGAMSELYIIAVQSENFDDFMSGYRQFMKEGNKDTDIDDSTRQWLNDIYQQAKEMELQQENYSDDSDTSINCPRIINWNDFVKKFNITFPELESRTYSVDTNEPCTLKELVLDNAQAVLCDDITELDEYIPLRQIIALKPGETYYGGNGADVERLT